MQGGVQEMTESDHHEDSHENKEHSSSSHKKTVTGGKLHITHTLKIVTRSQILFKLALWTYCAYATFWMQG